VAKDKGTDSFFHPQQEPEEESGEVDATEAPRQTRRATSVVLQSPAKRLPPPNSPPRCVPLSCTSLISISIHSGGLAIEFFVRHHRSRIPTSLFETIVDEMDIMHHGPSASVFVWHSFLCWVGFALAASCTSLFPVLGWVVFSECERRDSLIGRGGADGGGLSVRTSSPTPIARLCYQRERSASTRYVPEDLFGQRYRYYQY